MNELPIINWELGTQLADNKRDLAEELLSILINSLPIEIKVIKESLHNQNRDKLWQSVHKLHGAVCYCGTPRLKQVLTKLETSIKTNIMDNLPLLIDELSTEVNQLLTCYKSYTESCTHK
ncbi:MAG: hypothetical protein A3E83_00815 [Gammaproteobacteria bacterium RIFCSPHIGHO2_12_FULL_41_20]|nr:MAG: hypothetical protein A3E83_00815 [Gammaproteobacteria bacterium RIFCSPHIGHO2_12_FULL_41_20]